MSAVEESADIEHSLLEVRILIPKRTRDIAFAGEEVELAKFQSCAKIERDLVGLPIEFACRLVNGELLERAASSRRTPSFAVIHHRAG